MSIFRRTPPVGVTITKGNEIKAEDLRNPIYRCMRCTHWVMVHDSIHTGCNLCPCPEATREVPPELKDQLDHLLKVSSS